MNKIVKNKAVLSMCCLLFSGSLFAYGGGGGGGTKTACKAPKFSDLTPAHLAEVAPGSEISFKASAATDPDTVTVTAKKQPIEISISKNNSTYTVTGNLPATLTGTHARVAINAKSPSGCKGNDGWLIKITGGDKPVAEQPEAEAPES